MKLMEHDRDVVSGETTRWLALARDWPKTWRAALRSSSTSQPFVNVELPHKGLEKRLSETRAVGEGEIGR